MPNLHQEILSRNQETWGIRKLVFIVLVVVLGLFFVFRWLTTPEPMIFLESVYDKWADGESVQFENEPHARTLYERMIKAMQEAETLSYKSEYWTGSKEQPYCMTRFQIWLKKPNLLRMEHRFGRGIYQILIGDGERLWVYWPAERLPYANETQADYERTRKQVYYTTQATSGNALFSREFTRWMRYYIQNPTIFHGYTGTSRYNPEAVRTIGTEHINEENCDVLELRFPNDAYRRRFGQQSRLFWISQNDCLPRRIKHVDKGDPYRRDYEIWADIRVNEEIPDKLFTWIPHENLKQWVPPKPPVPPKAELLQPGEQAPIFALKSAEGKVINLLDYRGAVVWLNFWRVRDTLGARELAYLETMHQKYKDSGLVVLGINCVDDSTRVQEALQKYGVTYPNINDQSKRAVETYGKYRSNRTRAKYLIDRNVTIAASWVGYKEGDTRPIDALQRLGFQDTLSTGETK